MAAASPAIPATFQNNDATLREILTSVRTIAVVGASDKEERSSNEVMKILLQYGYRVIPINPRLKGQMLLGETVLGSLEELPEALKQPHTNEIRAPGSIRQNEGEDSSEASARLPREPVMVDIFRRSEKAGETVDQVITLCRDGVVSSVWLQIGVIDHEAAQRALNAGLEVAMNVCPAEEIPRLQITVPSLMSDSTASKEDSRMEHTKKSSSAKRLNSKRLNSKRSLPSPRSSKKAKSKR